MEAPDNLNLVIEFGGGAELLFGNVKKHEVKLPKEDSSKWTIRKLLPWIQKNLLKERPELFIQDESVRPGILVLVNDADWELLVGGTSNPSSHLLRHHQHELTRKPSEVWENANETEGKGTKIPDLVVKPREEIYLNCYLPQTTLENIGFGVSWLHNGLVVDTAELGSMSNGHRYFRDTTNGQLFISSIRLEDDGLWHCQYQGRMSDRPIASKPLKLVVLDKPRNPYLLVDGRRLDPGNFFLPVKESLDLSLTCVVEGGNPRPVIKWVVILSDSVDPVLLGDGTGDLGLNVTESRGGDANRVFLQEQMRSEARIASVQRVHHNATVVCYVSHVTLKTPLNASILLDVQYAPSFAISREPGFGFPLREGMSVSLKCDVDSNPPSSPIWLKEDSLPLVPQTVDGYLNFTSIKREHSGWYKCTSHHLLGEFSSIGYFLNVRNGLLPNVTQDPVLDQAAGRQVEVPLGGVVQLQCPEEAMGCWSRVGTNGRLEPVGPGPGLLLSNVLYQDAGEYRCVSSKRGKYDRWRSEVNVDVTVRGRPVVYPPESSLTTLAGENVDFVLEFCANPPATRAFWVTETKRLSPGQVTEDFIAKNVTAGSSIHCLNTVLTLKRAKPTDSGEYMFLVKSSLGVSQGTILLNVTADFGSSTGGNVFLVASTALIFYFGFVL